MPPKVKGPDECNFCRNRKKKGLGPCGHHGGPGNAHRKGEPRDPARAKPRTARKRITPKATRAAIDNDARAAATNLLNHLLRVREKLDEKTEQVRQLVEIL